MPAGPLLSPPDDLWAGPWLAIAPINPVNAHDKGAVNHPQCDCADRQDQNHAPSSIARPEMEDFGDSVETLAWPLIGPPAPANRAPEIFLTYPGNPLKHTQKYPKD